MLSALSILAFCPTEVIYCIDFISSLQLKAQAAFDTALALLRPGKAGLTNLFLEGHGCVGKHEYAVLTVL